MKKPTSQQVINFFRGYIVVTLAGVLNAISMFTFLNPATLIAGGFSGLSAAISHVLVAVVPSLHDSFDGVMSVMYFVFNVPILICALIFLRGDFTFKTIWATIVSTVVLAVLPQNFKFHDAEHSRLICVIFGGILIGIAMHIAYEYNGSNGGTEVIARIVSKFHPEMDISKVLLIFNFVITCTGSIIVMIFVPNQYVDVVLYSVLYILIGGNVLGMLKRGFNHPQKVLVITTKHEEIGADISAYFKRGYTSMEVANSYDGQVRKMIMVVVQYRQLYALKKIIKKHDPQAFTIIKDVHDVFSRPTFNRSYKTK